MGNKFQQQITIVPGNELRENVSSIEAAFFDESGAPIAIGNVPAAANADVASANATDLATALTLVNELKAQFNSLQAKLRTAGYLSA